MQMKHLTLAAAAALGLMSGTASASVIITVSQMGADVVASGTGTLDLTGLKDAGAFSLVPAIQGYFSYFGSGGSGDKVEGYTPIGGPDQIGPGTSVSSTSSTGDDFAFDIYYANVFVPVGYAGGLLTFSSTFDGTTISGLGLTPGQYTFTLPSDTIVLNIGGMSTVPLPASAPMFGAGLIALGAAGYAAKRKKATAAA
ncbi:MAG: hypothetical protein INR62_12285 [Rhodospirillales bacterium]|nr:hypothetical protein [Acetobacter sp.]